MDREVSISIFSVLRRTFVLLMRKSEYCKRQGLKFIVFDPQVHMKRNVKCNTTCSQRTAVEVTAEDSDILIKRIKEEYHVHL